MPTKNKIQTKKISPCIQQFKRGRFSWIDITKISKTEIDYIRSKHKIDPRDLADVKPQQQRPLIMVRSNYIFMILLFPSEDKDAGIIQAEKINFFIFPNKIITLRQNDSGTLKKFRKEITATNPSLVPQVLIHHQLSHLYDNSLPILNRLAESIDTVEKNIFNIDFGNKQIVRKIFNIELQVVDFRKILRSHSMIMDKLFSVLPKSTKAKKTHDDLQELPEYPRIIWTNLESQMEAIDTLKETYESLSSFDLNDIMKTLTIISMIIAPMTLIASVFGMNFFFAPLNKHPFGFTLAILLMIFFALLTFLFFKRKRWL